MHNDQKLRIKKGTEDGSHAKIKASAMEVVTRRKLDLTEGYERQRRRLLPNYEFHGFYNLDEKLDHAHVQENDEGKDVQSDEESVDSGTQSAVMNFTPAQNNRRGSAAAGFGADNLEATADLLRDLNLGRAKGHHDEEEDFFDMEGMEDETAAETATMTIDDARSISEFIATKEELPEADGQSKRNEDHDRHPTRDDRGKDGKQSDDASTKEDNVLASRYDLITGLLQAGDWPEKSYKINRCTGLEIRKGLLLWCREVVYIIDGFEQTDGEALEGKINRIEKESTSFYINLRPQDFKASEDHVYGKITWRMLMILTEVRTRSEKKRKKVERRMLRAS